ncbi:MAG: bifunctional serine/threonine-protein kinase/formylglycine-generating enzyme family protein [Acidobacteriota bacterium]
MLNVGDEISDYRLIRRLGEGQFGEVWLAEKDNQQFALKFPKAKVKLHEIEKEVVLWLLARGHRNVLPVEGIDMHDERVFIISEFAPDGSLEDWLRRHDGKAPSFETAIEMMMGILDGLAYLHKRKIIHRDIKPANVLLSGNTPRITDFGISKFLLSETESNMIKGSPAYMSPEAWKGERNEQTDLWSASVMFYEMLCGKRPFSGRGHYEVMYSICNHDPHPLPSWLPASLRDFIETALKKEPNARYLTAKFLRTELQNIHAGIMKKNGETTGSVDEWEKRRLRDGFVLIPAGEFMMGADASKDNERPVHPVKITKPFEMGKYQVTQELWQAVMGNNPSYFKGEANLPVESVSWEDVQVFIEKLNAKNDGYVYRLPTEAEWEYACRAGRSEHLTEKLSEVAWYEDNSYEKTHPVGQKKPNDWGLYDMQGNVWEWCHDWYSDDYYRQSPTIDPIGKGEGSSRVIRGGAWGYGVSSLRPTSRGCIPPSIGPYDIGFRLVRNFRKEQGFKMSKTSKVDSRNKDKGRRGGVQIVQDFVATLNTISGITVRSRTESRNVFDVTGQMDALLYIKGRSEEPYRWGVTANVIKRLEKQKRKWFVILLYETAHTGFLLSATDVLSYCRNTWPLGGDGDYKPATGSYLSRNKPFGTFSEFLNDLREQTR